MQAPDTSASSTPTETTPRSAPELEALVGQLTHEVTQLRRQVAWFQRQIFGQKSERRLPVAGNRSASGVIVVGGQIV